MTLVVAATAFVADWRVTSVVESRRLEAVQRRVLDDAWLLAEIVRQPLLTKDVTALRELSRAVAQRIEGLRVTVIGGDGTVLADSHRDPTSMEPHGRRPEVLKPGRVVQRFSATLKRDMIYAAAAVSGGYARVALDLGDVTRAGGELRQGLIPAALVALAVGCLLALLISTRISRPLARIGGVIMAMGRGEYDRRVEEAGASEFRAVARTLNDVGRQLLEREGLILAEAGQKAAIVSAMEEGLVALDRDHRVVLLNDAARRLLGSEGADVGDRFADLIDAPELLLSADRCLEQGERIEGEVVTTESDVIQFTASPLRAVGGATEMAVMVLRDVTAMRRLEQVRRDFVANVSHELKTPLTTMRGYIETVLDDDAMEPELRRSFLKKAERSTSRLASIVSDLLDLARLERSPEELGDELLDLSALVIDCVHHVENDAEERGVLIEVSSTVPRTLVRGDDQSLVTAVTNLLDNAVKYTPPGGRVIVSVVVVEGMAEVHVVDEGPGIPLSEQERIFERFYRIDKNRSRKLGGTGLGLSIVRNVALSHGGEVSVQSEPGAGSRFVLRLPREADGGSPSAAGATEPLA